MAWGKQILVWIFRFVMKEVLPVVQSLNYPTNIGGMIEAVPRFAGLNKSTGRSHGVPVYWWRWQGIREDAPVIIYFHGGGFLAGNPTSYRMFAGQLSRVTGCRVLGTLLILITGISVSQKDSRTSASAVRRAAGATTAFPSRGLRRNPREST